MEIKTRQQPSPGHLTLSHENGSIRISRQGFVKDSTFSSDSRSLLRNKLDNHPAKRPRIKVPINTRALEACAVQKKKRTSTTWAFWRTKTTNSKPITRKTMCLTVIFLSLSLDSLRDLSSREHTLSSSKSLGPRRPPPPTLISLRFMRSQPRSLRSRPVRTSPLWQG
jgi:hypothetical protein